MTYVLEVYYRTPRDFAKEHELSAFLAKAGGKLGYEEAPPPGDAGSVCLTDEFTDAGRACMAADELRRRGEHVEGPMEYACE